jgi:uroporphyrin-III C-methyltransferase/precorrin-2 dehydrogenase/sirohydrochlorin ferrochelatase
LDQLPIFLNLAGRTALVVGGGEVAARKVALLRSAGAAVLVVAPVLGEALASLAEGGAIRHRAGRFDPADLDGVSLVIAATDDRAVNQAVAAAGEARFLPVNVVDDPALCGFIMPAIVDRGRIVVAISTGGASPVLARLVRARLEQALPAGIERLADFAAAARDRVKAAIPDAAARRRFWEALLGGPAVADIMAGQPVDMERLLAGGEAPMGRLDRILVPNGEPLALTLGDVARIQLADFVLYEPAVPAEVLGHARRDATLRLLESALEEAEAIAGAEIAAGKLVVALGCVQGRAAASTGTLPPSCRLG